MGVSAASSSKSDTSSNSNMAGASEAELREAFKLFDADGDGMISADELKTLISKVGGEMADAEANALIHAADKDGTRVLTLMSLLSSGKLCMDKMREKSEQSLANWTQTRVDLSPKTKWLL